MLVSSKTAAEVASILAEMGFAHCPAIVENRSDILEPGTDEDLREFLASPSERGISGRRDERFITPSLGKTKADQMFQIASRYAPAPIIALGDAQNDAEMIGAANYGVIVKNARGAKLSVLSGEASEEIQRTEAEGPAGWNRAVLDLISKLEARKVQ